MNPSDGPPVSPSSVPASVVLTWRGGFEVDELDAAYQAGIDPARLRPGAPPPRFHSLDGYGWHRYLDASSLGWVVARDDGELVGFAVVAPAHRDDPACLTHRHTAPRPYRDALLDEMAARSAAELGVPVTVRR